MKKVCLKKKLFKWNQVRNKYKKIYSNFIVIKLKILKMKLLNIK